MPNDVMSISSSAINAYSTMLNNTANNIANINTDNYQPLVTNMQDSAGGGVTALTTRNDNAFTVDLSKEVVDTITAKTGVEANVNVIKTAQDIQKRLIDILA